jgi:tumor protein p53-inducible protein 3
VESNRYQKGAKVMSLLGGGGYAEYVTIDEDMLMLVPDNLSLQMAAGIPETWLTAYQLLHLVTEVKPGDTVV